MSFIKTYTDKKFYYDAPTVDMIDILDIAHALSQQCRFAGQCKFFYSVAQHSILASKWVLETTSDLDSAKYTLMHDASEAYCVDVPRPLKYKLQNYRQYEEKCQNVILEKFNLTLPQKYHSIVSEADDRMLFTEADALLASGSKDFTGTVEPLPIEIEYWGCEKAEVQFIRMFEYLFEGKDAHVI